MIKKTILILYISMISLFFSGCGTAILLSDYQPISLEKSKYTPSKDKIKNNTLPKVIIMDIDNNKFNLANKSNLGKSLSTNIHKSLSYAKSVNIINRVSSKSINEEIKAAELAKEIGNDVGQADYIITGEIGNTTYTYKFNEGYYYVVETKEGKKKKYSPPYINYRSCVSGNIKILNLPELMEVKAIGFDGCSTTSNEARSPRDAKRRDYSLVRQAGINAISSAINPLKNFFSKKGYIYEMKKDGDNLIIKTNLGSKYGAYEGAKIIIYTLEDNYNMLLDETKPSEIKIGNGKISNQINSEYSWIIVDKLENERVIKAGDFIKIEYTRRYFW